MGFEVTKGAWFYLALMVITIYIGFMIVAGLNPFSLFSRLDDIFEPSIINIADDNIEGLDKYVKLDCSANTPIVILEGAKFYYKGEPGPRSDVFEFIVVLDYIGPYQSKLFVGSHGNNNEQKMTCVVSKDGKEFDCPQDLKIEFVLDNIGGLREKEFFHFTFWKANQPVIDDANENGMTLSTLLQKHGQFYLSSFDVAKDIKIACGETECDKQTDEASCRSTENCYWGPWYLPFLRSCGYCPIYTECSRYDKDQCEQCTSAVQANCHPTLTGCEAD